jgi:glycosyltransferase involved in cell wall biosynthesis
MATRIRAKFGDPLNSMPHSLEDSLNMQRARPLIVAVIPAFNEEKNIAKVILLTKRYVDKIIVCDDGSDDMTSEIAESLGADVVKHKGHMGYGAALATLFKSTEQAGADVMVTIDGDGQHDPADVPRLTELITNGEADIAIGSRFSEGSDSTHVPRYRKIGIKVITVISDKTTSSGVTDAQSGLRAYSRRALELVRPSEMGMGASVEILARAHDARLRIKEIPVKITYDRDSSTHNPIVQGVDVVMSTIKLQSIRHPLIFYGVPGFILLLIALAFSWWDLTIFVQSDRVVTNIALVAVATGVIGLILMATAVMLWVLISVIREKQVRT